MEKKLESSQKDTTVKYSRSQRRDIERINEVFEPLMNKFAYTRALKGDTEEVADLMTNLNAKWRNFCVKHNKQRGNPMKADPEAFMEQINSTIKIEDVTKQYIDLRWDDNRYKRWTFKMELRYPWTFHKMRTVSKAKNIFNKEKVDYVRQEYEKLQGKSPGGTWF